MPTNMCNMNCVYCYNRQCEKNFGIMSLETLQKIYEITFNSYSNVSIIWHGGEPLLAGLDFFKKAMALQKNYKNITIKNKLQTNLTLVTDEWVEFFSENRISVGSSFDGTHNDSLRGNTEKILHARSKLLRYGQNCGFIMVISSQNIDSLIENYYLFKKMSANYTFNFYIPSKNQQQDSMKLNPEHAAKKILELYFLWLHDVSCNIHVNFFERIIQFMVTGKKTVCSYTSCLGKWIGIRYDGEIFPCNRYFPQKHSFGNVFNYSNIDEAFESDGFIFLLKEAIQRREKCKTCVTFSLCEGGCNSVAYSENRITENNGVNCKILQKIYPTIKNSLRSVLAESKNGKIYNPCIEKLLNLNKSLSSP